MRDRIGIFGGTFDPIHFGHLRSAEEIKEKFGLKRVIFVPPYTHPLKHDEGASANHRLEMVRLAVEGNDSFESSNFEVKRGEVSYTVVTLEHFSRALDAELFFILGADSWLEITSWYRYPLLFELANIIVHTRPGHEFKVPEEVLEKEHAAAFKFDGEKYTHVSGKYLRFAHVTHLGISATDIRQRRREGRSIRYLVPDPVLEYIEDNGLYIRL